MALGIVWNFRLSLFLYSEVTILQLKYHPETVEV